MKFIHDLTININLFIIKYYEYEFHDFFYQK